MDVHLNSFLIGIQSIIAAAESGKETKSLFLAQQQQEDSTIVPEVPLKSYPVANEDSHILTAQYQPKNKEWKSALDKITSLMNQLQEVSGTCDRLAALQYELTQLLLSVKKFENPTKSNRQAADEKLKRSPNITEDFSRLIAKIKIEITQAKEFLNLQAASKLHDEDDQLFNGKVENGKEKNYKKIKLNSGDFKVSRSQKVNQSLPTQSRRTPQLL